VYDAAGVRVYELPLTPERVFHAIQEYRERSKASD
jgi:4-hydroxybenzoyl-CoA reductase subunit alpha